MKIIKSIKFYAVVYVGKEQVQSYTDDSHISDKVQSKGITCEEVPGGVLLKQEKTENETFVPHNNVQYIQYKPAAPSKPAKTK